MCNYDNNYDDFFCRFDDFHIAFYKVLLGKKLVNGTTDS